jgi:ABC-type dipeptide/oligopeptide/nickel transport system ATPase component
MSEQEHLLEIRGLRTHFFTDEGIVKAVDGIDLQINRFESVGLVGESGCGKSTMALSVLRLLPRSARIIRDIV